MRYVESRFEQQKRNDTYRYYVCDSFQLAPQGQYRTYTLREIYYPESIEDEKTGDEIATEVMVNAGLKFG